MAEVQTTTQSGELTQRFIEFVMMQAQNAALFLGQIPNPQTGQGEVNLELAKMFIDQLAMIQEKTRGNLSNEEAAVLRNTLANLQMAFVDVSQSSRSGGASSATAPTPPPATAEAEPQKDPSQPQAAAEQQHPAAPSQGAEAESRKKFTKSYGA
jgi:hypothetical protein